MRILRDPELGTELQELYLTGKQWLSDVEFLTNEQRFLNSLLDKPDYFTVPGSEIRFTGELIRTAEEQRQLYLHVVSFMTRLEPLICETRPDLDVQLIEDFFLLQTQVGEALEHLKIIKYHMIHRKNIN